MAYLLDYAIHEAVERDGQPREADYDDGVRRMLYRDVVVQSCLLVDWPAISAALTAQDAARVQAQTDAAQLRQQILTIAQSTVGLRVDLLTAAQVRALFAIVLWQGGALRPDLTVRPLADWVDRP